LFFCCLAVETTNVSKVCQRLDNCRCLNDKNYTWHYFFEDCKNQENCSEDKHKLNNSTIHFSELKDTSIKHRISRQWLELLQDDFKDKIKLNLFIVNLDNLDFDFFGKDKTDKNIRIYNFVFKTLIKSTYYYLLKDWKTGQFQYINQIYHHRGIQEEHPPFFNNISKLELSGIKIMNPEIKFVCGNQKIQLKKTDEIYANTLIQFNDLILGSFRQLMYRSSSKIEVKKTANVLLEIFEKKENNQYTIKRKYKGNYDLNIWPNQKCDPIESKTLTEEIKTEFSRDNSLYSHTIGFLANKTESKKLFDF